jgi:hypothetical protein
LSRFTLGDGNEQVGAREIDKSWAEAIKILLRYDPIDEGAIARALAADESTMALLYFHLLIFSIERRQELAAEGVLGGLTRNVFSFIGYNMDPERFERTVAHGIADAVATEKRAYAALLVPA